MNIEQLTKIIKNKKGNRRTEGGYYFFDLKNNEKYYYSENYIFKNSSSAYFCLRLTKFLYANGRAECVVEIVSNSEKTIKNINNLTFNAELKGHEVNYWKRNIEESNYEYGKLFWARLYVEEWKECNSNGYDFRIFKMNEEFEGYKLIKKYIEELYNNKHFNKLNETEKLFIEFFED